MGASASTNFVSLQSVPLPFFAQLTKGFVI